MSVAGAPADPVFVGGPARSGIQAVARLVGAHPRYRYLDAQVRFHVDEGGLSDLLGGRVELARFLERLRGYWWHHTRAEDRASGLHSQVPRDRFEAAVAEFERAFPADSLEASRDLMRGLLDPLAREDGAASWVEWSTRNVAAGPTLLELFPDGKIVEVVRDGRDVACSLVSLPWGPDSVVSALEVWERQLRAAAAGARDVPPGRLFTVNIAELAIDEREESYRRLLDFLGLDDEAAIRQHFENRLLPGAANPARWEIDLSPHEQRELERGYERALAELSREGVAAADALSRRHEAGAT